MFWLQPASPGRGPVPGSNGEAVGKQFTERRGTTRTEPCPEKNSPVNV
jgi:hypothetical protein